jgi:hypothetical protein
MYHEGKIKYAYGGQYADEEDAARAYGALARTLTAEQREKSTNGNTKNTKTSFLASGVLPFEHKTFLAEHFPYIPPNMSLEPVLAGFGMKVALL